MRCDNVKQWITGHWDKVKNPQNNCSVILQQ